MRKGRKSERDREEIGGNGQGRNQGQRAGQGDPNPERTPALFKVILK